VVHRAALVQHPAVWAVHHADLEQVHQMTDKMTDKFARQLIDCLRRFGSEQSNPVLHLLNRQAPVDKSRYPDEALEFGNDQWRVFYHCHDSDDRHGDEHGHFHFFTRSQTGDKHSTEWSHLVALSMDNMGQPIQWFMVNQWVTGGDWFLNSWLENTFTQLIKTKEQSLMQQWCQAMLCLYKDEIAYLLRRRDKSFAFLCNKDDLKSCFEDRNIYLLSVETISLIEKLQRSLNTEVKITEQDDHVA
jgi:hypothetical protein